MYRSAQRRGGRLRSRDRRIAAVAIILVVFGALVTVTRVSSAKEGDAAADAAKCGPEVPGADAPDGQNTRVSQQNGRQVRDHWGDGQDPPAGCEPVSSQAKSKDGAQSGSQKSGGQSGAQTVDCPSVEDKLKNVPNAAKDEVDKLLGELDTQVADANKQLAANKGQNANNVLNQLKTKRTATIDKIVQAVDKAGPKPQGLEGLATCKAAAAGNDGGSNDGDKNNNDGGNNNNGGNNNAGNNNKGKLKPLADSCDGGSKLQAHDGFQKGNKCVDTEMGEVGNANRNPSLLITDSPNSVRVNQAFTIEVSTRNLIRDRFLAAAQGGYYIEMSKLNGQGLVRGHFHTACRKLNNTNAAPDPAPAPAFFVATEDNGGGAGADTIEIRVPGLPEKGTFQCASWAGDGSHRIPMMERANQTPAFDAVRVQVR
jgi:hypothetical protein